MRLAAFKRHIEALATGKLKDDNAPLVRALQKKEIKRCSQAWDAFIRNCSEQGKHQRAALRQTPPAESLPPVA